jgi:transcription elongation factor GreA
MRRCQSDPPDDSISVSDFSRRKTMSVIYLTPEGFEKLKQELLQLKGPRRKMVIQAVQTAREHGDLSENAEYDAAKEEQAKLEHRIHTLEDQLANAKIIDKSNIPEDKLSIGQRVRLRDLSSNEELEYQLVSPPESDFTAGKISVTSPIGRGLVGQKVGDRVEIRIPAGTRKYEILSAEIA